MRLSDGDLLVVGVAGQLGRVHRRGRPYLLERRTQYEEQAIRIFRRPVERPRRAAPGAGPPDAEGLRGPDAPAGAPAPASLRRPVRVEHGHRDAADAARIVRGHELSQREMSPIHIGTPGNLGLTGSPVRVATVPAAPDAQEPAPDEPVVTRAPDAGRLPLTAAPAPPGAVPPGHGRARPPNRLRTAAVGTAMRPALRRSWCWRQRPVPRATRRRSSRGPSRP